jgi:hypothetical protein
MVDASWTRSGRIALFMGLIFSRPYVAQWDTRSDGGGFQVQLGQEKTVQCILSRPFLLTVHSSGIDGSITGTLDGALSVVRYFEQVNTHNSPHIVFGGNAANSITIVAHVGTQTNPNAGIDVLITMQTTEDATIAACTDA